MSRVGPRLAPADEANLVLDRPGQVNVFLVAGILGPGGFVGPDGDADLPALRAAMGAGVDRVDALRKVPVRDGRRHRWGEQRPDLGDHVRLNDAVAGREGLAELCGRLMSAPLPMDRPLWELLVVPTGDACAFVLRIHHAIADGMAAVALVQRLFDPAAPEPVPHERAPRSQAHRVRRFLTGLHRVVVTLGGVREVGATVLLGRRSDRRGVAYVSTDLDATQSAARARGATVNDVLLTAVAAGYRAALTAAGETLPERLTISVPVALERAGTSGNQVGVMLVRLPLREPDPDRRLGLIVAQTRPEKVAARQQGTLELMRGPVGAWIMDRFVHNQHLVGGMVTNVPGPPHTLDLAGAPIRALWPVTVLAANVRLGVAALSYAGALGCSVHYDAEGVPGAAFATAMEAELGRLSG